MSTISSDQSFAVRFREKFERGLEDIKLFLRPDRPLPNGAELREKLCRFQDASTKSEKRLTSIDGHMPQVRFDAPFGANAHGSR